MQKKIYLLSAFLLGSFFQLLAQTSLNLPSQNVTCGQTLAIPVTVGAFNNLEGVQFSLNWDSTQVTYISHTIDANLSSTGSALVTNANVSSGEFSIGWFSTSGPLTLTDGDTILLVEIQIIGNNFDVASFAITGNPLPIEGTINLTPVPLDVTNGTSNLTLIDTETPTVTCPANQSATTVSGSTSVAVSGLTPSSSDNCGVASTTYTFSGATTGSGSGDASGQLFNIGTTVVTYTVEDFKGNVNQCSFNVEVTAGTIGSSDTLTVTGGRLIAQCDAAISLPVSVFGFTEITDLQLTVSFDPAQFTYNGVSNLNLDGLTAANFDASQAASGIISLNWDNAIAQTLIDGAAIFNIDFTGGSTVSNATITINGINAQQNNVAFPTQGTAGNITLQDSTAPTITCPSNQTVAAETGQLGAVVTGLVATATDNCSSPTITYTLMGATTGGGTGDASGTTFNIGVTTVTYTATDGSGLTTDCSFTVTVTGDSPSNFTLIAQTSAANCDDDDLTIDINVAAFDNITGTQFSVNWDPAVLTYTSTDNIHFPTGFGFDEMDIANGRIGYAWTDGTVQGQTLPDGTTLFTLHFTPAGAGTTTATFSDNPTPIEITENNGVIPFAIISRDSITLTAGTVTIADGEAPTITCPPDTVIALGAGGTSVVVNDLDALAIDNCGIASVTYRLSGATTGSGNDSASGLSFNAGTTTITYTATDNAGNVQECSSTVTVSTPNAIDLTIVNPVAECGTDVFRVDVTAENFDEVLGLQFSINWDQAVLSYDSIGNFGLPQFSINNYTTNFTNNGELGFAWTDNSGFLGGQTLPTGAILFSIYYTIVGDAGTATSVQIADSPVPREGSVKVNNTPTIVPVTGNPSQVTVVDNTPPVVTNPFPESIIQYVPENGCAVAGQWTAPTFNDACSDNLNLVRSHEPGTSFTVGQTTITYTATDPSGNVATSSTIFEVRDTTAPAITGCPTNITVNADANCEGVATWTAPTATDNCELAVISATHNPGTTFPLGNTTVTYTAEDIYGNRSSCSFVVTVGGVEPLVFNGFPGDISVNAAAGECGAVIGWVPPTATSACSGGTVTVTGSSEPDVFFPVGSQAVSYTATDASGNSITQTFIVTVIDNQEITVLCPTDIEIQSDGTVIADAGNFINSVTTDTCGQYTITFNDITAFDNCSPISQRQIQGPVSGGQFSFGVTQMEFEMADTLGNTRTCTFQIRIAETQALSAATLDNPTCAGSDLRLTVNTLEGGVYQWTGPGGFVADLQSPVIPNAMTQNSGEYVVKVISANGCTIKDSIMVGVLSGPAIEATGNDLDCTGAGDSIRLFANITNGIPVTSYQWTGPNNFTAEFQNPIIPDATTADVGIYTVTGTSSNGCSATDTVVVGFSGIIMPTLIADAASDTVCANSPLVLTGTPYDGLVNYQWFAPEGAGLPAVTDSNVITVTPTEPGNYTYSFTADLDGTCSSDTARISFVVVDGAGAITLGSNGPLDCANPTQTIDLTAMGGMDIATYAWSGPNDFTSDEQNPSLPVSNAAVGTYTLVTTANSGCTATQSIDVDVTAQSAAPQITITGPNGVGNVNACEGDALSFSTDTVVGATYAWVGPNGFTSSSQNIDFSNITANEAGAYQLTLDIDGCTSAPSTVGPINVLTDPVVTDDAFDAIRNEQLMFDALVNDMLIQGADFTVTIVSDAVNGTLNYDGVTNMFDYRPNTDFVGMDQIAYEVCYTDCPDLCSMATVTIRTDFPSTSCFIPTFISPNGDGFNDALIISCVADPPKQGSELIVFNEWGSEVFRESPYQNNWQGTYKGEDLPDGTYYYIFKEDSDDNDPEKGYVTIFR